MARVLWIGDAGCHTGFSKVTHAIGDRLVNDYGHDISVLAINFRGDHWPTPLKLYRPDMVKQGDRFGMTRIIEMLGMVEPEVVVILHDPAMVLAYLYENQWDKDQILLRYRPIIAYMPVDGTNQPGTWGDLLGKYTNPVVMSRWGKSLFPGAKLVYHGIDTDTFHPVTRENPIQTSVGLVTSKREAKEAFGYPADSFLVLRVDKNSGRKDFAATWKALVPVMKRHTDIIVHFHTQERAPESGVGLGYLFSREPELHPRFYLPDLTNSFMGWPESDLAALYNAADLFVTTSRGEGFGLTIAEALACGVPVVAQNVSSIPEVVGPGGVLVEPQRLITVPSGQDLWLSDINAFSEAIEHLYLAGGVRRKLGDAGREHIRGFSWDFAAARFDEFVRALAVYEGPDAVPEHERPASVSA